MNFYRRPEAFAELTSLYWWLRNVRHHDRAARRKWYRRIKAERERLTAAGFSAEHLRLYCRYLSNPFPQSPALHRLRTFEAMLAEVGRIQSVAKFADPFELVDQV